MNKNDNSNNPPKAIPLSFVFTILDCSKVFYIIGLVLACRKEI